MEQNKTGKYLKYAIGEIVLVVIGILIALSINNWNESQKKEKLKVSYRNSLTNDLSLDMLKLKGLIKEHTNELKALNNLRSRVLGQDTPIDTIEKIGRFEFSPSLNTRFQYNRNTLNTLIATGNIELFNQEFSQLLMGLISLQDTERENTKFYSQIYASKISRYSDNYPVTNHLNSNIVDLIWTNIDKEKYASRFVSLMDVKVYSHYSFIKEIEKVKKTTTVILKQINNQNW